MRVVVLRAHKYGVQHGKGGEIIVEFFCPTTAGSPARTVGWRDPGFSHTAYLKELWPSTR